MSLKAVGEVAVFLSNFRNIDIFSQGVYYLRCRAFLPSREASSVRRPISPRLVHTETPCRRVAKERSEGKSEGEENSLNSDVAADTNGLHVSHREESHDGNVEDKETAEAKEPEASAEVTSDISKRSSDGGPMSSTSSTLRTRPLHWAQSALCSAAVLEDSGSFCSSMLLIRYCEEEVTFNDATSFQLEIDSSVPERDVEVELEISLMFADILSHVPNGEHKPEPYHHNEFQEVSKQTFRLRRVLPGTQAFHPIVFDEFHFCQVDMIIRTSIVEYVLSMPSTDLSLNARSNRDSPYSGNLQIGSPQNAGRYYESSKGLGIGPALIACGYCAPGRKEVTQTVETTCLEEEAIIGLARQARQARVAQTAPRSPRQSNHDNVGESSDGSQSLGLAESVDELQQEYVGRLVQRHTWIRSIVQSLSSLGKTHKIEDVVLPGNSVEGANAFGQDAGYCPTRPSSRVTALLKKKHSSFPVASVVPVAAAEVLAADLRSVSVQVRMVWDQLLGVLAEIPAQAGSSTLVSEWRQIQRQVWASLSYGIVLPSSSLRAAASNGQVADLREQQAKKASVVRLAEGPREDLPWIIDDISTSSPWNSRPVLFEQRYAQNVNGASVSYVPGAIGKVPTPNGVDIDSPVPRRRRGLHLFVLVHGFQGQAFDMRLLKNNISFMYPKARFLCAESNEHNTESDIEAMGAKLAAEVQAFIQEFVAAQQKVTRLSFVSHSIGGLLVRAALPLLEEEFGRMFFSFISLSTPHLGYVYTPNVLFKTGLWLVKKFRQSACLEQLSMTDAADPQDTFLYWLARGSGLGRFKHVVLLSSVQDCYAPYESVRLEKVPHTSSKTSQVAKVYDEMVDAILSGLAPERVIRIDVDLHLPESNIDTLVGRAAHIQFIENQTFMRMLIQSYGYLFE